MNTIYVAPVLLNISIICADRKEQTFIDLKHYSITYKNYLGFDRHTLDIRFFREHGIATMSTQHHTSILIQHTVFREEDKNHLKGHGLSITSSRY